MVKRLDYRISTKSGEVLGEFYEHREALTRAQVLANVLNETLALQVWRGYTDGWHTPEYVGPGATVGA